MVRMDPHMDEVILLEPVEHGFMGCVYAAGRLRYSNDFSVAIECVAIL